MPRGRKPKPDATKRLEGNPGKRPRNSRAPKADPALPEPPEFLSATAKEQWERIAPLLFASKVLTRLDDAALAALCTAFARWVEAETSLREHGLVVKSPNGFPIQNPYLSIANTAMRQMKELLAEFGMTPSSRSRVEVPKEGDEETDAEKEYFG